MSVRVGDMWKMSHYMDALDLLYAEADDEEGDDTTKAVEQDVNPTLDSGANGKGLSKAAKREIRAAKRQKPTGVLETAMDVDQTSPSKRECSPPSEVTEPKKVKAGVDNRSG